MDTEDLPNPAACAEALTTKLDAYLSVMGGYADDAADLEMELLESLKNRSVYNYFKILTKIGYPMEKIHLLVERICRLTQSSPPSNIDLEPVSHSSSSDGDCEHERDSKLRCGDNQFGLLLGSGSDSSETESETESDSGDDGDDGYNRS